MNGSLLSVGLFFVLIGGLVARRPHRTMNFVPSREWTDDPERAKRRQERLARSVGLFVSVGLGGGCVVAGLLA